MNTKHKIRLSLTVMLLAFVWAGHMWAIKLCITLSVIAWETTAWILRNEVLK